jgi:hypothetical protein
MDYSLQIINPKCKIDYEMQKENKNKKKLIEFSINHCGGIN